MGNKSYFRYFVLKTLFQALNLLWAYEVKTLKSQLLKKLSIEIYKILDLNSPNIRKKIFVLYFMLVLFFSPVHPPGEL